MKGCNHRQVLRRGIIVPLFIFIFLCLLTCGCSVSEKKGDPKFIEDGIGQYNTGNYKEALWSFERYLIEDETSPTAAYAWGWKAVTYEALDKPDQALPCIEKAIAINPNDADFWRAKERFLLALDRDTEAAEAGRRAASLESTGSPAPTTSPSITTTTPSVTTSLTPSKFTDKDRMYLGMTQTQRAILYNLSLEASTLPPAAYQAHGSRFQQMALSYLNETEKIVPDDPYLHRSWELYRDALHNYALVGVYEEEAGVFFGKNDFTSMAGALQRTVEAMQGGNTNLTLMQQQIDESGIEG